MAKTNFSALGIDAHSPHTVTAAEATANTLTIDLSAYLENDIINGVIAQVTRAGNVVTDDLDITFTNTSVTFADGTTFNLTANDIISYIIL